MPFDEHGIFHLEEIAFCNTNQLNEAARHYKKHGVYTFAPEESRENRQFWDIEEDRRINGMTIPGKLMTIEETKIIDNHPRVFKREIIQEVHITGKHYGFLNYARIKRTKEEDIRELKNVVKDSPLLKHARKVGKKDIDFPSFLDGQYHWFTVKEIARKNGMNLVMTKSRRKGYSYGEGWDVADEANMVPEALIIVGAFSYDYLIRGNQIMPMAKRYLDFLELHTDFGRGYINETLDHIKLGYKLPKEGNKEFGFKSEIIPLSFMNNPDAAAGKDAAMIKLEECGKFPNLKEALDITMSTTEDGSIITGNITMFGTGGTDEANWADFQEIYYNPELYNCMVFDNIWDENAKGSGVGFFHPQEVGDPAFVDADGNSLVKEATESNNLLRAIKKKNSTPEQYLKYIGQRARTPQEAFASGSDNIFPAAELLDQLNKVEHNPEYKYVAREGKIVRTENGLRLIRNSELEHEGLKVHPPVFNFPLKAGQDVEGCYVEWITPYRDGDGKIPKGLYRLWHDPYAHDKSEKKEIKVKDSLGATYVYERPNNFTPGKGDYFVGCYVGRPLKVNEYNSELEKVCEYVNGEIMFENERGDVKGHFARARKLHLLVDEPDLEWEASLKGKTGRGKGMHVNDKRKGMGALYLRDWLLERRGIDINGNEKLNLHYIFDPALLRELLKWNPKGNFDRVSSLLVGMYDMKECQNRPIEKPKKPNPNSIFNRPLFK